MGSRNEIKKAACHFCHNNCGLLVHVEEGKVVRVTGNKAHPISRGYICARGTKSPKWLYHPDQLKHPLKRAGDRGEGKWERISWDQALDEIASKLAQLKTNFGAETLTVTEGTYRSDHFWARTRFLNLFGNPQNVTCPGIICSMNCYTINLALLGSVNIISDLMNTKCAVLWGGNHVETFLTRWKILKERIRNKDIKIIVVDPIVTKTASHADMCLQLRPGTDAALALGWINVIIGEGLYDKAFVEKWTHGFDKLSERVNEYSPERVSEITGLTKEEIVESARLYATSKPACIDRGVATDQIGLNSTRVEQARVILKAITGNMDVPGGNPLTGPAFEMNGGSFVCDSEMELAEECPPEQRKKQIGADRYKLMTFPGWEIIDEHFKEHYGMSHPQHHPLLVSMPLTIRGIINEDPYPIKAMICWASNPMLWAANTKLVHEALTHPNLELHVVLEYWMTPTAQLADYVLPSASWLERPLCSTFEDWSNLVWAGERAVAPLGERREDYFFWRELGLRLGQEGFWPWENLEEAGKYRIAPLKISYEEFIDRGGLLPEPAYLKYEKTGFATPTGKVELYSTIFEKLGYDPLPYYEEPPESPARTPELLKEYSLLLTTGNKFMPMFHSEHRQLGIGHREKHPDPLVHIHPETAQSLGISHGDWVYIETVRGKIQQKANVTENIRPDVVSSEASWWFPEKQAEAPSLFGAFESNANILTIDNPDLCDPLVGNWCNRGLLCKVYKA
jgi:anaerobic selenocysteine-containing dehydrogenase